MSWERIKAIRIQTDESLVIRRSPGSVEVWCSQCRAAMVSPEEGALLFAASVREIYRAIDAGCLHFKEVPAGAVLVCLESLRQFGDANRQIKNIKEIES